MINSETSALIEEIEQAFAERAHPGDDRIVAFGEDQCSEDSRLGRFLKATSWQDFDYHSLVATYGIDPSAFLYLLEPDAFAYYMPAFLIQALDLDAAPDLAESLHFALAPTTEADGEQVARWKRDHLAPFNARERRVIDKVYRFLDERLD